MTTAALKKEILRAIENTDDNSLLEAVFTILSKSRKNDGYVLSGEDIDIIEESKRSYKSGKTKTFTVEEVRKKILKNLPK
jgi:hypothetical protein